MPGQREDFTLLISRHVEKDSSGAPLARHLQTSVCVCLIVIVLQDQLISSTLLTQAGIDFVGRFFRIWGRGGHEMSSKASRCGGGKWHNGHLAARGHGRYGRETDLAQEGVS